MKTQAARPLRACVIAALAGMAAICTAEAARADVVNPPTKTSGGTSDVTWRSSATPDQFASGATQFFTQATESAATASNGSYTTILNGSTGSMQVSSGSGRYYPSGDAANPGIQTPTGTLASDPDVRLATTGGTYYSIITLATPNSQYMTALLTSNSASGQVRVFTGGTLLLTLAMPDIAYYDTTTGTYSTYFTALAGTGKSISQIWLLEPGSTGGVLAMGDVAYATGLGTGAYQATANAGTGDVPEPGTSGLAVMTLMAAATGIRTMARRGERPTELAA